MKSLETILAKQNFDDLKLQCYSPGKQTVLLEASKATVDYLVNFSKSALPCKWITGIFSTYEEITSDVSQESIGLFFKKYDIITNANLLEINLRSLAHGKTYLNEFEIDLYFNYKKPYCLFPEFGRLIYACFPQTIQIQRNIINYLLNHCYIKLHSAKRSNTLERQDTLFCQDWFGNKRLQHNNIVTPFQGLKIWPKLDNHYYKFNYHKNTNFSPYIITKIYSEHLDLVLEVDKIASFIINVDPSTNKVKTFHESAKNKISNLLQEISDKFSKKLFENKKYIKLFKKAEKHLIFVPNFTSKHLLNTTDYTKDEILNFILLGLTNSWNELNSYSVPSVTLSRYQSFAEPVRFNEDYVRNLIKVICEFIPLLPDRHGHVGSIKKALQCFDCVKSYLDFIDHILNSYNNKLNRFKCISLNCKIFYAIPTSTDIFYTEWRQGIEQNKETYTKKYNFNIFSNLFDIAAFVPKYIDSSLQEFKIKNLAEVLSINTVTRNTLNTCLGSDSYVWGAVSENIFLSPPLSSTVSQELKRSYSISNLLWDTPPSNPDERAYYGYARSLLFSSVASDSFSTPIIKEHRSLATYIKPHDVEQYSVSPIFNWDKIIYPQTKYQFSISPNFYCIHPKPDEDHKSCELPLYNDTFTECYGKFYPIINQIDIPVWYIPGKAMNKLTRYCCSGIGSTFFTNVRNLVIKYLCDGSNIIDQLFYLAVNREESVLTSSFEDCVIEQALTHPSVQKPWNEFFAKKLRHKKPSPPNVVKINTIVSINGNSVTSNDEILDFIESKNLEQYFELYRKNIQKNCQDLDDLIEKKNDLLLKVAKYQTDILNKINQNNGIDLFKSCDETLKYSWMKQISLLQQNKRIISINFDLVNKRLEVVFKPKNIVDPRTDIEYDIGTIAASWPLEIDLNGYICPMTNISSQLKVYSKNINLEEFGRLCNQINSLDNTEIVNLVDQLFEPVNIKEAKNVLSRNTPTTNLTIYGEKAVPHSSPDNSGWVCFGNYSSAINKAANEVNLMNLAGLTMLNAESANLKDAWGKSLPTFQIAAGKYSTLDLAQKAFERNLLRNKKYIIPGLGNPDTYALLNNDTRHILAIITNNVWPKFYEIWENNSTIRNSGNAYMIIQFLSNLYKRIEPFHANARELVRKLFKEICARIYKPFTDQELEDLNAKTKFKFQDSSIWRYITRENTDIDVDRCKQATNSNYSEDYLRKHTLGYSSYAYLNSLKNYEDLDPEKMEEVFAESIERVVRNHLFYEGDYEVKRFMPRQILEFGDLIFGKEFFLIETKDKDCNSLLLRICNNYLYKGITVEVLKLFKKS